MKDDERKQALKNRYGTSSSKYRQTNLDDELPSERMYEKKANTMYEDKDYYEDVDRYSNSKQKKILLAVIIIAILLVVASFFGFKMYKISSDEKKAVQALELGEFDEAEAIYSNLYKKTGDSKYKEMRDNVLTSKENETIMKEAKYSFDAGDYAQAVKLYAGIQSDDQKNYDKAEKEIRLAQAKAIDKIKNDIRDENFDSARSDLDSLKMSLPDEAKYSDLEKKISQAKKKKMVAENKPSDTTIVYKTEGIERIQDVSTRRAVEEYSQSIIGTQQSITSGSANVRSGPSKGSSIITSIDRGSTVYVEDTYVESAQRIWCKVSFGGTVGWISYNTMNNSIM